MSSQRPPLGLSPRFTYTEPRMIEIQRAMNRYMAEKLPVPEEWIREYNELAESIKKLHDEWKKALDSGR